MNKRLDVEHQSMFTNVIFNEIENAIASGKITQLVKHLGSQTYFSLSNGISGYYSSNQAYYVLEDFFTLHQVISFRFDTIRSDENSPYATGIFNYELKGKRETAQVYISLKNVGKNWKIAQITIN